VTANDLPRVLVVSHNPFSDVQNNGKTLQAFFEDWPRERLAQLYLTLDEPSFTNCDRFYRVTDLDVLKDLLPGRSGAAGPVKRRDWEEDSQVKASLGRRPAYRAIRKLFLARPPAALLARSAVWKHARQDDERFRAWLDEFDPQLVFFQSSSAVFAFDLVEEICGERKIPLVMETTDDYVTPGARWSPFSRTYYRQMKAAYARAVSRSYAVVAIGDAMAEEYAARFGGRWEVAMNSVESVPTTPPRPPDPKRPLLLLFAGNLGLNRWRVLAAVGEALTLLADERGREARLDVYSIDAPEPDVLEQLTASKRVVFRGAADPESLRRHRTDADVLVHVESFDAKNRHITRLSVSTKIPEYMAADRVILAVGPDDVASIRYIADEDIGVVVTSQDARDIAAQLARVVADTDQQATLRARALELVAVRHSRRRTKKMIVRLATEAVEAGPPAS
jgi:glycosyltransferase involved in cell wall biosynthesis